MRRHDYPSPRDIGLRLPSEFRSDRYCAGFEHALKGGHLTEAEFLRLSFRMGFRAAKRYLRELRRQQGIIEFPLRARFRMTAIP